MDAALVTAAGSLRVDAFAAEAVRALRVAGVPSILLKGPAIADWLYEDGERAYGDADLLVPLAEYECAERVLRALGYLPRDDDHPNAHARPWSRAADGAEVDLHRTQFGAGVAPEGAWRALACMTRTIDLAGTAVEVPVAPALALIVASHAAQHGTAHAKVVSDLERALERAPAETWAAAARLAERLDAGATLAIGLRTLPAGRALAEWLGLPGEALVRAATEPGSRARLALGVERLHRAPGVGARGRLLLREALPPREFVRSWSPLGRRGGAAGLAAAYGWRWLWLLAHAGPSVRAWRRSRT